jgi:hypothetical protein
MKNTEKKPGLSRTDEELEALTDDTMDDINGGRSDMVRPDLFTKPFAKEAKKNAPASPKEVLKNVAAGKGVTLDRLDGIELNGIK